MNEKTKLPPMENFNNVTVVPFVDEETGKFQHSGPIWPNWDVQVRARHCRHGKPFDVMPTPVGQIGVVIKEPLVWIGPAHTHFGHYIAEHSTRILQSIQEMPEKKLLFGCGSKFVMRHKKYDSTPKHFRAVNEWLGVNPQNVMICFEPMVVESLSVAAQAEQLTKLRQVSLPIRPADQYLDMLDENQIRNKLKLVRNKVVYVSRGLLPADLGQHGGAAYLDKVLARLGVEIFHPEKHSLVDQLATYAGADQLIVAEGSSLHGLQLLGRAFNSVAVLNRRKGASMIKNYLEPRCNNLQYLDAVEKDYCFIDHNGNIREALSFSIFDVALLFDEFKKIGIDLALAWDEGVYEKAVESDMQKWINARAMKLRSRGMMCHQEGLVRKLRDDGFEKFALLVETQVAGNIL